jgi:hypothetical protein
MASRLPYHERDSEIGEGQASASIEKRHDGPRRRESREADV